MASAPIWALHETHCGVIGPTSTRWKRAPAVSRSDFSPSSPNHAGCKTPRRRRAQFCARPGISRYFPLLHFSRSGLEARPRRTWSKNYSVRRRSRRRHPDRLSAATCWHRPDRHRQTRAFMLPSIDRLVASARRPQGGRCRMLVLAPTRELASQIPKERSIMRALAAACRDRVGGTSSKEQADMARGADILAPPGPT